ncbi:MFS transporter [Cellulomonas sp. SLBN-39]|uniref:MFS transporter n=1 Tax=Cellulomonas sp. SLBN-39 TaxID=2768446 RepID=UPI001152D61D|nr:MFS transporter [Cellulomonas sp. SLBN-39]TQL03988.1 MFS transporter [Cellulomonas sp. SLBN-39]
MLLSIPVQFGAVAIVERAGFRRTTVVGCSALLVLMVMLALVSRAPDPTVAFVVIVVLIEVVVSASWGLAWHPWMQQVVPRPGRPRYLATAQSTAQGFNVAMLAVFALLAGATASVVEYQAFLGLLAVFVILSIGACRLLPEPVVSRRADENRPGVLTSVAAGYRRARAGVESVRASVPMRRLLLVYVIDVLLATPLLTGYAVVVLGMPAALVAFSIGARSLCGVVLGPLWGRFLARHGVRRTVALSLSAACVVKVLWLLLPADPGQGASATTQVVFVSLTLVGAALGIGYGLSMQLLWYELAPESDAVALFTLKDVLESGKAQLGTAVAGVLVSAAAAWTFSAGSLSVDAYKIAGLCGIPVAVVVIRVVSRLDVPEHARA